MTVEIERKFLLAGTSWQPLVTQTLHITDGLLIHAEGRKLRVRLTDGYATLPFKGHRDGLSREEVELPLDRGHARTLLDHHCDGRILSKTRHLVPWDGLTWEIDIYDSPLQGIQLAEVEVPVVDYPLNLPDWVGVEVTGDPAWRKINMLEVRRGLGPRLRQGNLIHGYASSS